MVHEWHHEFGNDVDEDWLIDFFVDFVAHFRKNEQKYFFIDVAADAVTQYSSQSIGDCLR